MEWSRIPLRPLRSALCLSSVLINNSSSTIIPTTSLSHRADTSIAYRMLLVIVSEVN